MMGLVTDVSTMNGWFALLGLLGVLMLAIGNIALFAPPVATTVLSERPVKHTPVFRHRDLWS